MATKTIGGLSAANPAALSRTTTLVPVEVAGGSTVRTSLGDLVDTDTDPVKDSGTFDVLNLSAAAGAANSVTRKRFVTTGIPDATLTTVATINIPNTAQSALIKIVHVAALGTGGAIGVHEAAGRVETWAIITRTPGVDSGSNTALIATGTGTGAAVTGATSIIVALSIGANVGASSADQTRTITVTVTKGGGGSDNHLCLTEVTIYNMKGSGITVT